MESIKLLFFMKCNFCTKFLDFCSFLQIGVTMAKLWTLLNYFFMKCILYLYAQLVMSEFRKLGHNYSYIRSSYPLG